MNDEVSSLPKKHGKTPGHQTGEKARPWLLTLNFGRGATTESMSHTDQINFAAFKRAAQVHPCTYAIFQAEKGHETGTLHLQAYVEFAHGLSMGGVKRHFGINSLHCEVRRGTQQQAIDYCSKADTRVSKMLTYGTPMKCIASKAKAQGNRADWDVVWKQLREGLPVSDIIDERPYMLNNINALCKGQWEALKNNHRKNKTQLIVFSGQPRTGKSWTAHHWAKQFGDYYMMPNDGKAMWWNGYDPLTHSTIILDEFTGSKCPLTFLNQLADKYPFRVQTKGGFLPFLAKRIIITSNFLPSAWYDFNNAEKNLCYEALESRIDIHVNFSVVTMLGENPQPEKRLHLEVTRGIFDVSHIRSPLILDRTPVNSPPPSSPEMGSPPKKRKNPSQSGNPRPKGKRRLELYSDEVLDGSSDNDSDDGSDSLVWGSNDPDEDPNDSEDLFSSHSI